MTEMHANIQEQGDTVVATAKTRMNLAIHHLFAACRLAARVGEIERANASAPFGEFWEEIFQNSLGVAMMTVACMECYANELFFENSVLESVLTPVAAATVADLVDKQSILRKYSTALAIRTGSELEFGIVPVENAHALIRLRNRVVHFYPEWFGEQGKHKELSKVLQDKFKTSGFLASEPVFPRAWASNDFCVWALRTTVTFLKHFYAQAGLPFPLEQWAPRLSQLSANAL